MDPEKANLSNSIQKAAVERQSPRTPEVGKVINYDQQPIISQEELRPPLPPRPSTLELLNPGSGLQTPTKTPNSNLQASATTALSLTDIHSHSTFDDSRDVPAVSPELTPSGKSLKGISSIRRLKIHDVSEGEESASVRSYSPTVKARGELESLLGEVRQPIEESSTHRFFDAGNERPFSFAWNSSENEELMAHFAQEFDDLEELDAKGESEERLLSLWKSKLKHFLIFSSAGKPIYNRHGSDNLISSYIGVIQTIISFYESAKDELKGFTAGNTRFVVMARNPLYLVAITKLGESDPQLRVQLEALYMQILSTLTLPNLTRLFSNRPSTDLRRPLQGTEPLLSALADTFTRGSPSTLLSALECLKLRESNRQLINNTFLQKRCETLLYGLIVADGRLVSVIRPRRHSLHPSDLQLIFNMLFEAEGIKGGGGENWIPLCLPSFNKNGYLYMYVSFIHASADSEAVGELNLPSPASDSKRDEVVLLLISANKESFYLLQTMRDAVIQELESNGSMSAIKAATRAGRPSPTDIIPGTVLRHFLYKSRANVQFVMPSYSPDFTTALARRRLLSLYHSLHAAAHAKNTHLKVHHSVRRDSVALAWQTPEFEMYCVAGPTASRNAMAQSANAVLKWARREEERIFIIGGAVF